MSPLTLGLLAGVVNFGILLFNVGLTQWEPIAALDPNVFSHHGQLMILVWGLAFAAAGISDDGSSRIWFAFAVEKAMYVFAWLSWMSTHDALALLRASPQDLSILAPLFMSIYGPVDLVFFLAFARQGLRQRMAPSAKSASRSTFFLPYALGFGIIEYVNGR